MRRHLWNTTSIRSSHQRRKEGIFNAGTKLYARGGSGPGAGHLKSHAYKVIHKLNAELREKGYLTISGRVNRNFFMEKFCYGKTEKEG